MTTQPPTSQELVQHIASLLKGFQPDFLKEEYSSRKTAKRHAEKLDTAIHTFFTEIIENYGYTDYITPSPYQSDSFIIALPGSDPAGIQIRESTVDTRYIPRPANRYAYRPEPTYEIRRYIYAQSPEYIEREHISHGEMITRKGLYGEGRQLAQIIRGISTYNYQDLPAESRQEVKDLVSRYQALLEELATITAEAIRISRNGRDY